MPKPKTFRAVPVGILKDGRGRIIPMEPGPCLWCGEYVTAERGEAGATRPFDPCWAHDGDFGCDASPEADEGGCGEHARPYDLALLLLKPATLQPGGYDAPRS